MVLGAARSWSAAGTVAGVLMLVASHATLLHVTAHAQDRRVIRGDASQYFNGDRRVRVESATIGIESDGTATLYFQAAAMVRARFPGESGPGVHVVLVNAQGRRGQERQVAVASVDDCGGYKNHAARLNPPFPVEETRAARSFVLSMPGGASPVRC